MRVFAAVFVLFALQVAIASALADADSAIKNVGDITCPDGSTCSDDNTCCKRPTGLYGCCGYANAVCCNGTDSCCPEDNTCNPSAPGMCLKPTVCPDRTDCPGGNYTCCYDPKASDYACCPYLNAVCCADGVHCCPTGTTCDLSKLKCLSGEAKIPMFRKQPSRKSALKQPTLQQKLKLARV